VRASSDPDADPDAATQLTCNMRAITLRDAGSFPGEQLGFCSETKTQESEKMNMWKLIECAREDRPAELQHALDLFAIYTESKGVTRVTELRLAYRIALGNSAQAAAMREYAYWLALAVSADYCPSHCVWRGHTIGL
jgi:hypothetical protein